MIRRTDRLYTMSCTRIVLTIHEPLSRTEQVILAQPLALHKPRGCAETAYDPFTFRFCRFGVSELITDKAWLGHCFDGR